MSLHDYLILYVYCYITIFVVKCEANFESSNIFGKYLSLVFPKLFFAQEKSILNVSEILNDRVHIGYNNKVNKNNEQNLQNRYIKGHSLRIPKNRLFENGTSPNVQQVEQEIRNKRGVIHLYNMISCATGCNPLSYKGYGCFCGLLGSGHPVDGIDRCCQLHDWCYDVAKCPMYLEYFIPYYWKCWYNNRPFCALDHEELGYPGSCASRLCECDRALSECLRRYPCPSQRAICKYSRFRFFQNAFMSFT